VARQQINLDVNQQISITQALEQAMQRAMTIDMEPSWPERQNAQ
jgi:hypothetical protein